MACELVFLSPSSNSFSEVARLVESTCPNGCIISIEKINNPFLEERFQTKKQELRGKGPLHETTVFHGARDLDSIQPILETGFDASKNRVSAYGRGTYFATRASYSRAFCGRGEHYKVMLICDIFYQRPVKGRPNAVLSPTEGDCWVDRLVSPAIYSMPRDDQCIPRFLVQFF